MNARANIKQLEEAGAANAFAAYCIVEKARDLLRESNDLYAKARALRDAERKAAAAPSPAPTSTPEAS